MRGAGAEGKSEGVCSSRTISEGVSKRGGEEGREVANGFNSFNSHSFFFSKTKIEESRKHSI